MEDKKINATDVLKKAKKKNDDGENDSYKRLYVDEMRNKVSKKIDEKDPAVIKALRALMDDNKSPF